MSDYGRPTIIETLNYQEKTKTPVVASQSGKQIVFKAMTLNNRSGGTLAMGAGFKVDNTRWLAGQWTQAGTPKVTDDTTDAQSAATGDFPLFTTTANGGFVVQCIDRFGFVGVTVSVAASGGSPVYEYTYWNGTTYATLTLFETPTWTSTGEKTLAFVPPVDWATNTGTAVTDGLTTGYYSIRVRSTTASATTGGTADILWVARLYDFKAAVVTDSVLNIIPEDSDRGIVLQGGEGIIPYFSTANANNSVTVRYSVRG